MIQKLVDRFMSPARQAQLREMFAAKHPDSYVDVVRSVVAVLRDEDDEYSCPDPERVHSIDDGDYQGTLVFVIGAGGYQPSTYWYVKVGYGSCSGCDTLQAIRDYGDDTPSESEIAQYMTLALHVVQGLKQMGDDDV